MRVFENNFSRLHLVVFLVIWACFTGWTYWIAEHGIDRIRPYSARRSDDGWHDPRPDDRSHQPELPKLLPGILAFPIALLRGVSDSGDDTVVGAIAIRHRGVRTSDDGLDRWSSGLVLGWHRLFCSRPLLRPWDNREVAPSWRVRHRRNGGLGTPARRHGKSLRHPRNEG